MFPVLSFHGIPADKHAVIRAMPRFMLLIVEPNGQRLERSEAEGREAYASMQRWAEALKAEGRLHGVESLTSLEHASRVAVRGGRAQVLDGPFAEAKEMVGGFFLVECETHADAVALATHCPAAAWASVEVRSLGPCFVR